MPYLIEIIEARRARPGDDLLSALLAVEDDGDTLSPEELISFVVLLYVAGHETTVNLIGNGTLALLRHPDQLDRWRHDPSLDATAVDELLRFDGPVQHTVRVAMQPMTFLDAAGGDVVVEPGHTILTVLGAANHDPTVFDDPTNSGSTARMQAVTRRSRPASTTASAHRSRSSRPTIAITRLIRRFDVIELAGDPHWRDRITIRGVDRMPLSVR